MSRGEEIAGKNVRRKNCGKKEEILRLLIHLPI
jgi:hypothetical protein